MPDILWPDDLAPWRCMFYLQPHVGGQESPLTRTRKTYELSAPRWIARLTFRGGYDGAPRLFDPGGFGPRLDALIADLRGGAVKTRFHDYRRPAPTGRLAVTGALVAAQAAARGATSMRIAGFAPHSAALSVGDYLGGDGRPHLVSVAATIAAGGVAAGAGTIFADAQGVALVGFNPPLAAPIAAGAALSWPVTGRFELINADAGANETEVGGLSEYALDFVEDLT